MNESALERAQRALVKALQEQGLDPFGAGLSGYINSSLQSARIDALTEVLICPPLAPETMVGAIEAATVKALEKKAAAVKAAARQLRIAGADEQPRRLLAN